MRSSLLVVVLASCIALPTANAGKRHTTTHRAHVQDSVATTDKVAPPSLVAPVTLEPAPPEPGMTLAQGTVLVHTALELSLSADSTGAPTSIAPDLSVGVTDDLTLSIVHSGSALTGFRGGAGAGLCFSGDNEGKCRTSYAGGGLEGLYSLTRGDLAIAANAGLLVTAIDPTHTDLKLGFKSKLTHDALFVTFSPSIWYALNDRYDRIIPHDDQVFLPLGLWNKPTAALALGIGTGVKGPVKHFTTRYAIPLGVAAQYAVNPRVAVGSSFVFGRVIGGTEVMNPAPGLDARVLQMWLSVASR